MARQLLNPNRRAAACSAQPPHPQLSRHKEVAEGCSTLLRPSPPQLLAGGCSAIPRMPQALYLAAAPETPTVERRVCLDKSQHNPVVSLAARLLPSQLRPHLAACCAFSPCSPLHSSCSALVLANPFDSGGGLNKPTNQQQPNPTLGATMNPQVVPGVRIDLSNMKSTTRFNDLHEDIQKGIADIDKFIQNCMSQKDQLDAFMPAHGEQLSAIPGDVRFVGRKYAAVDSALGADLHAIKQMRDLVKSDAEEAKLSFSAVDNLMLPSQYHVNNAPGFFGSSNRGGSGSDGKGADDDDKTASDLVGYFSKQVDEMDEQIKRFQKNVREIEMHLGGVQQNVMDQASRLQNGGGGLGAGSAEEKQMELYAVLRDFEESILQVASVVGAGREGVTELQLSDFRGRGPNGVH